MERTARTASQRGIADTGEPADDYKDRLLKYIPAEAVAGYLTLDGLVRSAQQGNSLKTFLWVTFFILLIFTPIYLSKVAGVSDGGQLALSTVAFVVWVFALGGAFSFLDWYSTFLASFVLIVFTLFAPLYKPPPPAPAPPPAV